MYQTLCIYYVALMFAVQNFCERHQDRSTLVGTDEACTWGQPKKQLEHSKT